MDEWERNEKEDNRINEKREKGRWEGNAQVKGIIKRCKKKENKEAKKWTFYRPSMHTIG
jgi:hypothetical protein